MAVPPSPGSAGSGDPGRGIAGPTLHLLTLSQDEARLLPVRPAAETRHPVQRGPGDRRADLELLPGVHRGADDHVDRWLELPTEGGPDIGERPVLRRRQGHGDGHGEVQCSQFTAQQLRRQRVEPEEAHQQRRQQPVLVFGALRPGGDQVGQLEVPGWEVPGDDPRLVGVVLVHHPALATAQVLADVVEVDVDRRCVPPACPVAGGRVEDDLDVAGAGLPLDQGAECGVHLVDHDASLLEREGRTQPGATRLRGTRLCPLGQARRP